MFPDKARPTRSSRSRLPKAPAPAPTSELLHEWALDYLSKCSATAAGLSRVLQRRIATWARRAGQTVDDLEAIEAQALAARERIAPVVARLREVGLIDDVAFVERRARGLGQAGKSRRAIVQHLIQKGASEELASAHVPVSDEDDLLRALVLVRKKRLGPFAREEDAARPDPRARQKALATLARAGFGFRTCQRALDMDRAEAEERVAEHRRGAF